MANTPWGPSQSEYIAADGITFYSTASHGGYHLSPERCDEFYKQFPTFQTFAGQRQWFEEDCDACAVVLAFPTLFRDDLVRACYRQVEHMAKRDDYSADWAAVLRDCPMICEPIAKRAEAAHAGQWERGSMWGPPGRPGQYPLGSWGVNLIRVGDGARKTVVVKEYPKPFYTDEELALVLCQPAFTVESVDRPSPHYAFNEVDCGGAFDGFCVTSDADPGL